MLLDGWAEKRLVLSVKNGFLLRTEGLLADGC
jgi:hypothetical protein